MTRLVCLRAAAALLALFVVGCANVQIPQSGNFVTEESFTHPPAGERATASIGDTLISQGTRRTAPALELAQSYRTSWIRNSGQRAFEIVFTAGTVLQKIATMNGVAIYAGPAEGGMTDPSGRQLSTPYGLGVARDGAVKYVYVGGGVIAETPGRRVQADRISLTTKSTENFKQQFIYNGRNDAELFFTYREFVNDLARPAFQQDVRYQIARSDTIGFKSLRLRIHEVGNQTITYEILQPFETRPAS